MRNSGKMDIRDGKKRKRRHCNRLIGWSRRCPGCSGTPFFHHHLYGLRNTFVRHSLGWASSNHLDPREFMRFCHYDGSSSASTTRLRAASRSSQYPSKKESHVFSSTRGSGSSLYLVSRPVFRQLTNLALLTAVRLIGKDLAIAAIDNSLSASSCNIWRRVGSAMA